MDQRDKIESRGELEALTAAFDWAATPVGPRATWPVSLETMVSMILASNHPMFIWWGPELIQFYNDAYRQTMGPERHPSALGQPGRKCWDEIWPIIGPQIESVLAGGPATWHEDQLVPVTRHGSRQDVWWTYGYSAIASEGRTAGVLVVCTDVTVSHAAREGQIALNNELQAEVALRKYEQRRRNNMFQQAPGFMCVLSGAEHRFEFANDAYRTLIGKRDPVGKSVADALPETVAQGFIKLLDNVYTSGQPFFAHDLPISLKRADSDELSERILDFVYQPVVEPDGRVSGIFVQGNDVTDRKRSELALTAADQRKNEFLAMLAHELRNPLAPITAAAQLLQHGQLDAKAVQLASGVIHRQAGRMASLIDDLLDASRISRGQVSLDRRGLDLRSLVAEAVEQVRPLLQSRNHRLQINQPDELLPVMGDPQRLVQVIANLLDNAAKYTQRAGLIELTLRNDASRNEIVLSVKDNGAGINAELLPHVFELFAQGARPADRGQGGLGIGLSLARAIVELHSGNIEAISNPAAGGSTFTVRLPRFGGKLADAAARVVNPAARASRPRRILVVDDNIDAGRTLAMCLSAAGHSVAVETDGNDALAHLQERPADVYVLDIGLPGLDGNALSRKIRVAPGGDRALIIAVSGYGQARDREAAKAAGFNHYFVKPVDTELLLAAIEQNLEISRVLG